MKYFRIGNTVDDLPLYIKAPDQKAALVVFENLCGPVPAKILKVAEIKEDDIPEGDEFLS